MRVLAGLVVFLTGAAACDGVPDGNRALGIEVFRTEQTPRSTTVVGLDAAGAEVGRLELVHGEFTLTGVFRDDYDTPEVVGRQLVVELGEDHLRWETAGFAPTLHLPAHPPGHEALAAFLADPHVKPVLDTWVIGFERPTVDPATTRTQPFVVEAVAGTFVKDCLDDDDSLGPRCGYVRDKVANMCGNGGDAYEAIRITRAAPHEGEDLIAQCCPAGTGNYNGTGQPIPFPWFDFKVCPTGGLDTTCGEVRGACKACPSYPPADASGFCHVDFACDGGACQPVLGDEGMLRFCYSDVIPNMPPGLCATPGRGDAPPHAVDTGLP